MVYLLVWKVAGPWYPNSDARCRRIVEVRSKEGRTLWESLNFDLVARPDLIAAQVKPYHALNADAPTGPLLLLAPVDAPRKLTEGVDGNGHPIVVQTTYTQQEMEAGV